MGGRAEAMGSALDGLSVKQFPSVHRISDPRKASRCDHGPSQAFRRGSQV